MLRKRIQDNFPVSKEIYILESTKIRGVIMFSSEYTICLDFVIYLVIMHAMCMTFIVNKNLLKKKVWIKKNMGQIYLQSI